MYFLVRMFSNYHLDSHRGTCAYASTVIVYVWNENIYIYETPPVFALGATITEIILGTGWANGRRRYIVTSSFIGGAYTQNDPCMDFFIWFLRD